MSSRFQLRRDEQGYHLADDFRRQKPLRIRFDAPDYLGRLSRAGKRNELLARAVKLGEGERIIDCTAGLGRDGFLLAYLGAEVTMIERSPVIALLLRDGLERAALSPDLAGAVARINLVVGEAHNWLLGRSEVPDRIYIDPMFPTKQGSAQVKGAMQHLQRFLGSDEDTQSLLTAALATGCKRVIVKRPPDINWQPSPVPSEVMKNRTSRYEIFL